MENLGIGKNKMPDESLNPLTSQSSLFGDIYKGKKIFVTGHTGFKGSWLCLWLYSLGAEVIGYALNPPTNPSLFALCNVDDLVESIIADIRDIESLTKAIYRTKPEIVIHMAAQSLVNDSYKIPLETYAINTMGTINLFEAVRNCSSVKVVVNVTTDKCYENEERIWGYRENDPMGGYDPYSNSKACSELITSTYRSSFFNPKDYHTHGVALATARAGNVIGGGDWTNGRLIPDCVVALLKGEKIRVRSPRAVRPWQHVLEPLSGYLMVAQKLYKDGPSYGEAWNFGPYDNDAKPVEWIVKKVCEKWGNNASYEIDEGEYPHEATYLKLDASKARLKLGWYPRWNIEKAIEKVIEWVLAYKEKKNLRQICLKQIEEYLNCKANM